MSKLYITQAKDVGNLSVSLWFSDNTMQTLGAYHGRAREGICRQGVFLQG